MPNIKIMSKAITRFLVILEVITFNRTCLLGIGGYQSGFCISAKACQVFFSSSEWDTVWSKEHSWRKIFNESTEDDSTKIDDASDPKS